MIDDFSDADVLTRFVDARDEVALEAAALEVGVSALLAQVSEGLCRRYRPDRNSTGDAVLEWDLATPDGPRVLHLHATRTTCTAASRPPATPPNAVLLASLATFLRIVSGRLNAMVALSRGALRVNGDRALALRQQLWFVPDLSGAGLEASTPRELAAILDGRSDAEIDAGVAVASVDRSLREVFSGMVQHYKHEKGPRRRSVIEFAVRTEAGPQVYQFTADPQVPSWRLGAGERASVQIELALPALLQLVSGRLDGFKALAQNKLRVRGNLFLASGIQKWFDLSA
jgi:putative sterol carrier protein